MSSTAIKAMKIHGTAKIWDSTDLNPTFGVQHGPSRWFSLNMLG